MELHYQLFPEEAAIDSLSDAPLIIIPGLFGSVSNWRSIARTVAKLRPVIVIDQRNHGRSPHADTQSYDDMVADLLDFCHQHDLPSVHLAGHSMGGKVAMLFALAQPQLVNSLIVLDIAPVTYKHSHAPFLSALLEIDLSGLESRSAADRALRNAIPDTGTRLFLLQSLAGSPGSYHWRLNLEVLHEYMDELVGFPNIAQSSDVDTLVVGGEQSTYLLPEHHASLRRMFPNCRFATVANAGHWLHAEQPDQVIRLVSEFLPK